MQFSCVVLVGFLASYIGFNAITSTPGDIYSGELVSDSKGTIVVDTTPCAAKPTHISSSHFRLNDLGESKCSGSGGRSFHKVQVEELDPALPSIRTNAPAAKEHGQ
jgi:hypothetical protein